MQAAQSVTVESSGEILSSIVLAVGFSMPQTPPRRFAWQEDRHDDTQRVIFSALSVCKGATR